MFRLTENSDIISFAGGLPDPNLFPAKIIEKATVSVLSTDSKRILQYGASEGYVPLKQELIKRLIQKEKIQLTEEELIITTGSQQGLDIIAKIFLNYEDIVIVEEPSYLGGLMAFKSYGAKFIGIPCDENGMRVEIINNKLKNLAKHEINRIKFVYIVPDFQNPGGTTLSLERRKKLIELAEKYDFLIVEDTPYKELRYSGKDIPSLFSLAPQGRVITLCSFSKLLCPGFRLGYTFSSKDIVFQLATGKQSIDLCTPPFIQAILAKILENNELEKHIQNLISVYGKKEKIMLNSLNKHMLPLKIPTIEWTKVEGGLFLWIKLPEYIDTEKMIMKAIEKKVAYVPGTDFYHDGSVKNCMRLNFSSSTFEQIDRGIKRLAEVIKSEKR
ncbi:MAG: PLP-dependent aminotransferase family protein [bacterium]|nr:PLP-dependent aminotransferase family protein [bacterium]